MCEAEKPNSNKQRANDPKDDLHDSTLAAQINDGDIDRKRVAIEKPAGQPGGLIGVDRSPALHIAVIASAVLHGRQVAGGYAFWPFGAGVSYREFFDVVARLEFVQHVFELAHRKDEQALVFVQLIHGDRAHAHQIGNVRRPEGAAQAPPSIGPASDIHPRALSRWDPFFRGPIFPFQIFLMPWLPSSRSISRERNSATAPRTCRIARTILTYALDQLLTQKLMLEFAEEDFLRIANRHG
ncbi:hypothetical protein [Bradyrhizobium erythrophlei]|uniref:hypothetical protein n=1 Tax=Bradyrhizobium erythrophlei TaxID=1437360 RepID=UPI0012AC0881|nr:hypothetical protein [Bradyrhizobium erythrophlei]